MSTAPFIRIITDCGSRATDGASSRPNDGGAPISIDGGKTWDWRYNVAIAQIYRVGYDEQNPYRVCGGIARQRLLLRPVGLAEPARHRELRLARRRQRRRRLVGVAAARRSRLDLERRRQRAQRSARHLSTCGSRQNYDISPDVDRHQRPRTRRPGVSLQLGGADRVLADQPFDCSGYTSHTTARTCCSRRATAGAPGARSAPTSRATTRANNRSRADRSTPTFRAPSSTTRSSTSRRRGCDARPHLGRNRRRLGAADDRRRRSLAERHAASRRAVGAHRHGRGLERRYARRAYVAIDRHVMGDPRPYVLVTDDSGATWRTIVNGLPRDQYVHVVREDPDNPDVLYAGLEQGVWFSLDRGAHWRSLQLNMPSVAVHDLRVQPQRHDLLVATHGRGFWILDDSGAIAGCADAVDAGAPALFPLRTAYTWYRWWSERLRNASGRVLRCGRIVQRRGSRRGRSITYYLPSPAHASDRGAATRAARAFAVSSARGRRRAANRAWDLAETPRSPWLRRATGTRRRWRHRRARTLHGAAARWSVASASRRSRCGPIRAPRGHKRSTSRAMNS